MCCLSWNYTYIPDRQGGGRPLPLRCQQRRARPRQPAQRPAPHRRSELEAAHGFRRRPALDPDRRCARRCSIMSTTTMPVDFPHVPDKSRYVTRGIPMLALDWRWPFVAESKSGHSYVLEPIAQLIAQPYGGNPSGLAQRGYRGLRIRRQQSLQLQPAARLRPRGKRTARQCRLHRRRAVPGGEVEAHGGPDLSPQARSHLLPALTGENGTASDVVGRFSVKFPHLDFTDRMDFDRGNGTVRRHEIYVTGTYDRSSLQVSYVQLPAEALNSGPAHPRADQRPGRHQFLPELAGLRRHRARPVWPARCSIPNMAWAMRTNAWRSRWPIGANIPSTPIQGVPPSTSVILRFSPEDRATSRSSPSACFRRMSSPPAILRIWVREL